MYFSRKFLTLILRVRCDLSAVSFKKIHQGKFEIRKKCKFNFVFFFQKGTMVQNNTMHVIRPLAEKGTNSHVIYKRELENDPMLKKFCGIGEILEVFCF